MTDAKQEALRQALSFHNSLFGSAISVDIMGNGKRPTPDQVIATAKKFEAFLDPHHKTRK